MVPTNGKNTKAIASDQFSNLDSMAEKIYGIEQHLRLAKIELSGGFD